MEIDEYIVVEEREEKCIQASVETKDARCQTFPNMSLSFFFENMKNEKQLSCCTGLSSFGLLHGLCSAAEKCLGNRSNHALHIKDQVLMTLMKVKLNCSFLFLSVCFNVD